MRSGEKPHVYRFGGFAFDARTGELTGNGMAKRLAKQPACALALLVSRPGELVTREELYAALWDGRHVDAEHGLNFCVRQLRAALGDDPAEPRLIETVRGRGYRFVGAADEALPPAITREVDGAAFAPPVRRLRLAAAVALAAVLAAAQPGSSARSSAPHAGTSRSAAATEAFIAGSYLATQQQPGAWRRAAAELERAVALDAQFGRAHGALAALYVRFGQSGFEPGLAAYLRARNAADRALVLDPSDAGARLSRAIAELYATLDWRSAEQRFREAVDASPDSKEARLWHARALAGIGRPDEAIASATQIIRDHPSYTDALFDLGWFHYFAGRYDEAAAAARRVLDLEPDAFTAWHCLALSEALRGRFEHAAEAAIRATAAAGMGDDPAGIVQGDRAPGDALRWAADRFGSCPSNSLALVRAQLLAVAGDAAAATAALDDGVTRRLWWSPFVAMDPALGPLSGDPS